MNEIGAQKPLQTNPKNDDQNESKLVPKGVPEYSKIDKNEVLEASCCKGGSQVASRPPSLIDFGEVLGSFGTNVVSFSNICLVLFACVL